MKDKHIIAKCKTIEKYLFLNLKKFIIDNIFYKMRLNKKSGMKKCRKILNIGVNKAIKKGVSDKNIIIILIILVILILISLFAYRNFFKKNK